MDLADPIQPQHVLKGHNAPVTSLTIHPTRRNVLLSGSADQSVKVWDLSSISLVEDFPLKNGEIQNLKWNPSQESSFLCQSGSNQLSQFDLRTSKKAISNIFLKSAGVDSIEFNSRNSDQFFIASEDGKIAMHDARMLNEKPIYVIQAHNKSIPGLSSAGDYLVSNSLDGKLRIWDLKNEEIKIVKEKETPLKQLFVSSIHPENPFLFACGAQGAEVVVWDFFEEVEKGKQAQNPEIGEKDKHDLDMEEDESNDLQIE